MAKSILQNEKRCFLCNRNGAEDRLEEHHIFFGIANRAKSEEYGLKVYLCGIRCHRLGKESVHKNASVCRRLQAYTQVKAMQKYKWTEDDFREIFGRNYLD